MTLALLTVAAVAASIVGLLAYYLLWLPLAGLVRWDREMRKAGLVGVTDWPDMMRKALSTGYTGVLRENGRLVILDPRCEMVPPR